jgi:hypothetical protein
MIQTIRFAHYAILAWGLLGWIIPSPEWLIAYMIALPVLGIQWLLNRNTCVLNNLETWLRNGKWRDDEDAGQGGFIAGVIEKILGLRSTPWQTDFISYGLLGLFWLLAIAHYSRP